MAKLLLESGVDMNTYPVQSYFSSEAPLNIACEKGDEAMVQLLLSHNADPNIVSKEYNEQWDAPPSLTTSLLDACQNGHYGVTKLLVEAGVDLESTINGSILHYASKFGDERLFETLPPRGVDIHAPDCGSSSYKQKTPLHHAASGSHVGIIKSLVQHGVKISATDYNNGTAIDYAVCNDHADAVYALIQLGVDPCEKIAFEY